MARKSPVLFNIADLRMRTFAYWRYRPTVQSNCTFPFYNGTNSHQLKPGFHSNASNCVACVNKNRKKRKRLRWQAANHSCHCFDRAFLLAGTCVYSVKISRNYTQQTQVPANRNAWSKQWQPRLAACQRKRLCFLRFSFTQCTQRKRLRLNGNRALLYNEICPDW